MSRSKDFWPSYHASITSALAAIEVTDAEDAPLPAPQGFERLCEWTRQLTGVGRTLFLVGNGASAGMASHLAADWTKNGGVRAVAFNDVVMQTAIGNDMGFDQVFSGPLRWFGESGDMLATVSSSGASPNVLRAIDAARSRGIRVVTLSGMSPDNFSRRQGDLNFYVPALTYGIVECAHQVILHAWLDQYMGVREWESTSRQLPPSREG